MKNAIESTLYTDISRDELSIVAKKRIKRELELEAQRKTRTTSMLEAIPEDHEHAEELRRIVESEWHVGMLEMNSGNGRFATEWNPDIDCEGNPITQARYAQGSDTKEHEKGGLAEEITDWEPDTNLESIDMPELVDHAYIVEVPVLLGHTLDGEPILSESDSELVNYSPYSIWDTIASKGALIVRLSAQWKDGFRSDKWEEYAHRREVKKVNKAINANHKHTEKRISRLEARKAKRLAKMQRRGGGLAKIGYNAFS